MLETDLYQIFDMTTALGAVELCIIKGIGPKVTACALLFGFGKYDAFPIDVWIKRAIEKYFPGIRFDYRPISETEFEAFRNAVTEEIAKFTK